MTTKDDSFIVISPNMFPSELKEGRRLKTSKPNGKDPGPHLDHIKQGDG